MFNTFKTLLSIQNPVFSRIVLTILIYKTSNYIITYELYSEVTTFYITLTYRKWEMFTEVKNYYYLRKSSGNIVKDRKYIHVGTSLTLCTLYLLSLTMLPEYYLSSVFKKLHDKIKEEISEMLKCHGMHKCQRIQSSIEAFSTSCSSASICFEYCLKSTP